MIHTTPKLIVMLTRNDRTVPDAPAVFERCRSSRAEWFGFKEEGLAPDETRRLFARIRDCGKKTALEVVAYTKDECLAGARLAADCGVDLLMGTFYSPEIRDLCRRNGIRYFPFVGRVRARPSILEGSAAEMLDQAAALLEQGVDGFDLLGYRYTGDAEELIRRFVSGCPAPVCVAGSIHSEQRLDAIKAIGPWGFTIGSAFFDHRFGPDFAAQIDHVCARVE